MSSGKVQNPPGFALCRVAKSKTRRVLRHVVWRSPKPAGFQAMSCGEVQNLPNFSCTRVGAYCIRSENVPRQRFRPKTGRVLGVSLLEKVKSDGFFTYPFRGVLHTPRNNPRRGFAPKTGRVLGVSLSGGEIGCVFGVSGCGKYEAGQILHIPV